MMIDPATIGFDIDGVVADTMSLFIDILRQDYDIHSIQYDDIRTYDLTECLDLAPELIWEVLVRIMDGDYKADLKPMPGAARVLRKIGRFRKPLPLVTARSTTGPLDQWLKSIFNSNGVKANIIATGASEAKADILKELQVDWFVEDKLDTCYLLDSAKIKPILFRQPWNREPHPFMEVGSWDELEAKIDFA